MNAPRSAVCRFALAAFLISCSLVAAEDISVYDCVSEKDGAVSVGNSLAVFKSGGKTIMTIYKDFYKTSWTAEPFYGPVVPYIFKDSDGRLFLVHFEFKEGHEILGKGLRFAIAPLKAVKGSKRLYTGSPYDGSSVTDEGLLKQLRLLSVKKKP
jgi:hypothetical protein